MKTRKLITHPDGTPVTGEEISRRFEPKEITITQEEFNKKGREIAEKSFVMGVSWLCEILVKQEVLFAQQAELFKKEGERLIKKIGREL